MLSPDIHRVGTHDLVDIAGNKEEMQRLVLLVLQDPAWKGCDVGFQPGSFPVVHYCGLALADYLLELGIVTEL